MVTRKSLPGNAAVEQTVPSDSTMSDTRYELDASEDQIWAEERRNTPDQSKQQTGPSGDIPNALRPGVPRPANYSSLETEENVWGETVPSSAPGHATGGSRPGGAAEVNRVPTVLRPGGGAGRTETNPFKRKPSAASKPVQDSATTIPPTTSFSQLSINDTGTNPWKPAVDDSRRHSPNPPAPNILDADAGRDIWDSGKPSRQPTPAAATSPALLSLPSETGSAVWDDDEPKRIPSPAAKIPVNEDEMLEGSHAWDDLGTLDKGKGSANRPPPIPSQGSGGRIDEWNLIDLEGPSGAPPPGPPSRQSTWENFEDAPDGTEGREGQPPTTEAEPPSLPPRRSVDDVQAPPGPPPRREAAPAKNETYQIKIINWHDIEAVKNPRQSPILVQNANGPCPLVALVNALSLTTPAGISTALVETLRTREQVSLSLLLDAVFDELMSSRRHNPNVPLPDVAELYDFLKGLHTGMNVNPRFVPTEEHIKAFKRTSLTHLHPSERADMMPGTFEETTEMKLYAIFNVPLIHGWLPPNSDPVYDAFTRRAASYEDVQNLLFMEEELEDKLSNPHHQGLTEEEQEIYQDILTIKSFLSISATQLTPWGLKIISQAMRPGSIAILFRNDHFTTLYRHPQTQELLTLVTDAGYAGHEEIVWESLVDINGEHAEFFSGDFRLVGGASQRIHDDFVSARNSSASNGAWTTVQGRRGTTQAQTSSRDEQQPPLSPTHEQEDRDLALALQLQEEEDERHRAEQARRRRESMLSEQFIEQQGRQPASNDRGTQSRGRGSSRGRGGGSTSSARRSSGSVAAPASNASTTSLNGRGSRGRGATTGAPVSQTVRSLIPPRNPPVSRAADEGLDDAPPSYEQAAKQAPYVPTPGQPSTAAGSSSSGLSADMRRITAATAATSSTSTTRPAPGLLAPEPRPAPSSQYPGRSTNHASGRPLRQGAPPSPMSAGGREASGRDRDCVVM